MWWHRLTRALVEAEGLEAAVASIDEAVTHCPRDQQLYLLKARFANRLGDQQTAVAAARKAAELKPNDPAAVEVLAIALGKADKRSEAIALVSNLRQRSDSLPASLLTVFARHLLAERQLEAALQCAEEAIAKGNMAASKVLEKAQERLRRRSS